MTGGEGLAMTGGEGLAKTDHSNCYSEERLINLSLRGALATRQSRCLGERPSAAGAQRPLVVVDEIAALRSQ